MQIKSLFVSLLLTGAVIAKGHKANSTTMAVTDKSLCKEMASLTKEVNLAANSTKLAEKTKNNSTKIAEIQAKASAASVSLATMQSNTTLVSTCAVIDAAETTQDTCEDMADWQKLVSLAGNQTALDAKAKNNATKIAALQAKASKAATKLAAMSNDTTLADACASITSAKAASKAAKEASKNGESA